MGRMMEESAQIIEYPSPAPIEPANPIPSSIVMAIAAVMSSMQAVQKSNKNQHGGYNFASTDDIYAAITKKMGEIGFVIIALEEAPPEFKTVTKDGKASQWMQVCHLFILATKDATWTDRRCRRTLTLQITGPQSFQAAQSYNEKAFLRSLFKIPTGDMDLDSMPEGFEFNPLQFNAPKAPPPAPAGAEESLKSDAEMLREMSGLLRPDAQKPAPDMKEALKNFEVAMGNEKNIDGLNELVEMFNKKYDGHIDQQVRANLDVIYDANVARLAKKK
jgi:hypothetical protein